MPFLMFCSCAITFLAGMYLLKVNNKNTRTRCEICSELTIKTINSGQKTHLGKIIKTLFKTSLTSRCF